MVFAQIIQIGVVTDRFLSQQNSPHWPNTSKCIKLEGVNYEAFRARYPFDDAAHNYLWLCCGDACAVSHLSSFHKCIQMWGDRLIIKDKRCNQVRVGKQVAGAEAELTTRCSHICAAQLQTQTGR